ncbi:MAG: hypothetical protein ACKO7R_03320 [Pseudanabaena sp.]
MPEIGLEIGRCLLPSDRFGREVLSWFDERGQRYLTGEEKADLEKYRADTEKYRADFESQKARSEKQRADAAQKQMELLLAKLRSLGISED